MIITYYLDFTVLMRWRFCYRSEKVYIVLALKKDVFPLLMDCYEISLHFEFGLVGVILTVSVRVMEKKSVLFKS